VSLQLKFVEKLSGELSSLNGEKMREKYSIEKNQTWYLV